MSFPNIVYGKYGDEKKSYSSEVFELGQRMVLPNGNVYAFAHCSSTAALSIGEAVVQKAVSSTGHVVSLTGSAAVGATTVAVTLSGTGAVTTNQFKNGTLFVFDDNGQGYAHQIKSHASGAVSSTVNFILYPYDSVQVLIKAASSKIALRENEWENVLVRATGTSTVGIPAGVPANTIAAGYYGWLARQGKVGVLVAGTVGLVGEPAVCATTVAGGFQRILVAGDTTTAPSTVIWGFWEYAPAASTDYGVVYLTLD